VSRTITRDRGVTGLGKGIIEARLRQVINRADKEGNSNILLGDRHRNIGRDVLLVSLGYCSKDFIQDISVTNRKPVKV
jgi:hypothetical protein